MAKRQQARHRELYDLKCRDAALEEGDLVLVKQTAWKGRHKTQDRWVSGEYQVVGQPTPGVPVYIVKSVAGGRTRILHRNLLLSLQGRVRQQGGTEGDGISGSEDEEEGRDEMPKVARVPQERPRKITKPKSSPTQQREASLVKDVSLDLKDSLITTPSSPESISGDEDNSEEELFDSLTSHTTSSDSTFADLLTSTVSTVENISNKPPSATESQFSSIMPYLEESSQSDWAHDSVFTEQSSQHLSDSTPHVTLPSSPPESPAPRRSARSTKGRVSHWNKSSEFTLLTFTTFVPRPKKVQKIFSKFSDTILITPWAIDICCYIKKLILLYRLVP